MSISNGLEMDSDGADPPFSFLVENLFAKLDSVHAATLGRFSTVTALKVHIIREFVNRFRTIYGSGIVPTSRLILPDKAGRRYYIKNVVLAQLIIKMYSVPRNTDDFRVLKRWKLVYHSAKRFSADTRKLRDLPLRALRIIANRRKFVSETHHTPITVSRVNGVLDSLTDSLNSREQIAILKPLLDECLIPQVRWILHFILNKTILGKLEHVFFETWHPDALRLYQVCNSLNLTLNRLKDPVVRMEPDQLNIKPLLPFKPQLSQRLTANYNFLVQDMQVRSNQLMDGGLQQMYDSLKLDGKFYIEEKMDGDRMLLHYHDGSFKFYSRRLRDYTLLYGESYASGALSPHLRGVFPDLVQSVVLDGEMVAWDHLRQQILPFGTLKLLAIQETVRQFTTVDHYRLQHSLPFFLAFDVVHLNGKNLANHPLFFRKAILQKVVRPVAHYLQVLPYTLCETISDIQDAMRRTVVERREGVIVKHVQLTYQTNHRSHQWIKIKPEYLETFGDNLDVVIMGKNPAIKNAYMCGLRDDAGNFRSFCTVGNGFTDTEYDKIERYTHGKWHPFDEETPPSCLLFGTKKTCNVDPSARPACSRSESKAD